MITAWVNSSEALWHPALALLLQVSVALLAGLLVQQIVTRSAVARHSVLLWTLIATALCPALAVTFRSAGVRSPVLFASPIPFSIPLHLSDPAPPLPSAIPVTHPWLPAVLLFLWAAGVAVGMVRLAASWLVVHQLRSSATSRPVERIALLMQTIGNRVNRKLPRVLSSEQAGVPMVVGFWRPAILIPPSILDRLDDRQLLQVLMHECAHALRRDAFVGLFERALSAMLWFHPLIHIANRLLDRSREEICDNYCLNTGDPRDYCNTLLAVAQAISHAAISQSLNGRLAPSLHQPAWSLEDRVAGLLNSRRCLMTKLTPTKSTAIAIGFLGGALALSCLAGAPQNEAKSQNDFSHVVQVNKTYSAAGDTITVDQVRGPSGKWVVGNTYEVTGTYKLASRDRAMIAAFVTISGSQRDVHPEVSPGQTAMVSKGEGRFTLRFHMWQEGAPHVSFYPAGGGEVLGGVYF